MKQILIVDDEPLVRRSLARLFQNGYHTIEASDGLTGFQLWQKQSPDIVFLDVLMPGMTGPEILRELDPVLRSKAKVILISAYTGGYNLESARSIGADLFIAKPFEDIFAIKKIVEDLF